MKRILTSDDVLALVRRGETELVMGPEDRLTDLARELAQRRGAARQTIVGGGGQYDRPAATQKAFGRQRHRGRADARRQQRHRCAGGGGNDKGVGQLLRAERLHALQCCERLMTGQLQQGLPQGCCSAEAGVQPCRAGRISHPRAVSTCIWGSTAEKLQKLPHSAKAAVRFGRVIMARSFLSVLRALPEWPAQSGQSALRRSAGRSAPAEPAHARRAGPAPRRLQSRCRRAGWQGR